ncbi:hypothetical protein J5N97_005192 [Dioscorea zingiberensis]|uniref:Fatty acyl-CoA reductase n=1 Tax=Dioscorea zingiberensis TaxID=325984 RepID=A0A9D5HSH5_9LILI|nr:hypothetical protein J5N97_005192 [Dioscorea zingiberensis]
MRSDRISGEFRVIIRSISTVLDVLPLDLVWFEFDKVTNRKLRPPLSVSVVAGDTSLENLGIGDTKLINVLWREIDFIVNSAATTRFNERANKFGWPNVYSFTKAMGELQIAKLRGSLPVIILRPTIILSTCKEPFPGWIEGIRTMDKLIMSYGNGEIVSLPACLDAAVDAIPGDMVVNAMLATMVTNYSHPNSLLPIYHVGSSSKNTLRFRLISETSYKYFSMHPFTRKDGKLITVRKPIFFSKMFFYSYMVLRYKSPLQVLLVVATLLNSQILKNQYIKHNQTYNHVMLMAKAYMPYTFMFGRFDDTNTEILRMRMNNEDKAMFSFDAKCINWDQFLMDIHIPGVIKYGLNG